MKGYDFGTDRFGNKIRCQDMDGLLISDEPNIPFKYEVDGFGYFSKKRALKAANGDLSKIKERR